MLGRKSRRKAREAKKATEETEDDNRSTTEASEEEDEETVKMSLFQRLFSPGSVETDVSDDDDDDSQSGTSLGSGTQYSEDLSESTEGQDESTCEYSATSSLIKFDKDLRARHRAACKYMTVGREYRSSSFVTLPNNSMTKSSVLIGIRVLIFLDRCFVAERQTSQGHQNF